ncbi:MAG: AgmX/PglI C-terminal domain-containing protein [Deltaproteobacteria bacterium]|nr:AgmX/PglI C-terminal domain-containing protein [Deltaproteobacteria bacterium]
MIEGNRGRYVLGYIALLAALAALAGCKKKQEEPPQVSTSLPIQRVVLYRNGVGYFERAGQVQGDEIRFAVRKSQVGDFLASLTVVSRDGRPVEFVSFPVETEREKKKEPPVPAVPACWPIVPPACPADVAPEPEAEEDDTPEDAIEVVVRLKGGEGAHDVLIAYVVESPIWRPTYRIVLDEQGKKALLQGWAVVQNLSGEDWTDVALTVTEGAPLTFRADLAQPFIPGRPLVTDRGEIVQAAVASSVSVSDETRRTLELGQAQANAAQTVAVTEAEKDEEASGAYGFGLGDVGQMGHGYGTGDGVGFGRGGGRMGAGGGAPGTDLGGSTGRTPDLRLGEATTYGGLSKEVIRRIVQQHRGRIRHCYEASLQSSPELTGRVTVRFSIAPQGNVLSAENAGNTTGDDTLAQCIVAVVNRMAFPQGDGTTSVTYPFLLQVVGEGETTVGATEPPAPPPPPPGLTAAGAQASLALLALGSQEGGITTYRSNAPVTVRDEASTLVAIFNQSVEASDTLLFRPDAGVPASSTHPFRVVRFTNQAGVTLERGPVAIFGKETFLGQGVLEPLPTGATTSIPYALERGVTITVEPGSDLEEARLVKLVHGVLTVERFNVRKTRYTVQNLTGAAGRVYVQHTRWTGWELKSLPQGAEEVDATTVIVPVEFPAQGKVELELVERSPTRQDVELMTTVGRDALALYLQGPAIDEAAGPALRHALELRDQVGQIDDDISRFSDERDEVSRAMSETQGNLYAIEGINRAGELRTRLTQRLADLEKHYAELQTKVIDLTAQRGELMVEMDEALRDVTLEVPDEPAPAPSPTLRQREGFTCPGDPRCPVPATPASGAGPQPGKRPSA